MGDLEVDGFRPESAGPIVEHVVVDPEPPRDHGSDTVTPTVRIWNDGSNRSVQVFVRGAATGIRVDRTVDLGTDEVFELTFRTEDGYLLTVTVGDADPYATVVGRDLFFCNESTTTVRVGADGAVTAATVQTMLACPTPTATE